MKTSGLTWFTILIFLSLHSSSAVVFAVGVVRGHSIFHLTMIKCGRAAATVSFFILAASSGNQLYCGLRSINTIYRSLSLFLSHRLPRIECTIIWRQTSSTKSIFLSIPDNAKDVSDCVRISHVLSFHSIRTPFLNATVEWWKHKANERLIKINTKIKINRQADSAECTICVRHSYIVLCGVRVRRWCMHVQCARVYV